MIDPTLASTLHDLSQQQLLILSRAKPFTLTSPERMASLLLATEYIVNQKIPGDIVECGVWQGGSMMIVAQTLLMRGDTSRTLYLYDTFEGMSEPTVHD
ncbi:MAG: TylF/MycF/NovP-related O-methyltransferase, partial [Pirellula sp.]